MPSNYWNFKRDEKSGKFDLKISLSVDFSVSRPARGVVLYPRAHGTFVSPVDELPNFRMVKALAESDQDAPELIKELAASNGRGVVNWTEIGLGGIMTVADLFEEFARGNEAVMQLAYVTKVFDPTPLSRHPSLVEPLYIIEPEQAKLMADWRKQLEDYRNSLIV